MGNGGLKKKKGKWCAIIFVQLYKLQEEGDNWLFLHWIPKFYNNVFLFVVFTTLGNIIKF